MAEEAHCCDASAARMSASWSRSIAAMAFRSTSSSIGGPGGTAALLIHAGMVAARPRPNPAIFRSGSGLAVRRVAA